MAPRPKLLARLRTVWDEAIKLNKEREAWPTIQRARELYCDSPEEQAGEFLEEAVQRFPDNPEFRMLNGVILLETRPEDGLREVARAAASR